MKLVDEESINELLKGLHISQTLAGGSVANSLSTIAKLGGSCGFIGNRKNDKYGKLFTKSMEEYNIRLFNKESMEGKASSICLVLVTPNGERTMCTYLGASTKLDKNNLNLEDLKKSNVVYLEGYLFDLPEAKEIFYQVVENAKEFGYKIKLIGKSSLVEGSISKEISPMLVKEDGSLGTVEGVSNVVCINTDHNGTLILEGEGAGEGPTSASVLSDIVDFAQGIKSHLFNKSFDDLFDSTNNNEIYTVRKSRKNAANWYESHLNWLGINLEKVCSKFGKCVKKMFSISQH